MLEGMGMYYDTVYPSQWQNYCKARGRTTSEKKKKTDDIEENKSNVKKSKVLSIEFVKDNYDVVTDNDNIADAICIGNYVVNNVNFREKKER